MPNHFAKIILLDLNSVLVFFFYFNLIEMHFLAWNAKNNTIGRISNKSTNKGLIYILSTCNKIKKKKSKSKKDIYLSIIYVMISKQSSTRFINLICKYK